MTEVVMDSCKAEADESTSLQSNVTRDGSAAAALTTTDYDVKHDFDEFCRFAFPDGDEATTSTDGPFYFESDHVALKDNDDYRRLVRAFVLLESQRTAALRDVDVLLKLQQQALRDPLDFAHQLRRGCLKAQFPRPRTIAELPTVAWERYTDDVEAVLASLGGAVHSTRQKQKRQLMSGIRDSARIMCPASSSASTTTTTSASASASISSRSTMNGCVSSEPRRHRPATFNQPWTVDEQRLLEQLLEQYPPERFEARRFAKIAARLPGRTTQQVTSRVQKYFIKLAKAGLPVPGRMPNLAAYGGRWCAGRFHGHHQRHNHYYFRASTFLTSYAPPVYMSDDDDDDEDVYETRGGLTQSQSSMASSSRQAAGDELDDVPTCLHDTDEYRELKTLTALRQSLPESSRGAFTSHVDLDYTAVSSYLDPNYMPAL